MIKFEKLILDNGLTVLVHEDNSTPLVAMNILYKVGSRNEHPDKTGFAHLFEHLMFGGSVNIPSYDEPLQRAGGENNAFTSNDLTNYYLTIPASNIETGFWLESDRMLSLAFSPKSLEVQRNVVIEEFRQRYLNQPYGDVWLQLRPLAYKVHPYQWATIGKDISHIEQATLDDVKDFFKRWYCPSNAILSVAGNCKAEEIFNLSRKWFGPIASGNPPQVNLPQEPEQHEMRVLTLERDVPNSHLYMAFHCCGRNEIDFYATDLLSDVLARGKSSPLYYNLVREKNIFSDIGAYMLGELDKSLLLIHGELSEGINLENATNQVWNVIKNIQQEVTEDDLIRVRNKAIASVEFAEINIASRALHLAYFEMLGNADLANQQISFYENVNAEMIRLKAKELLQPERANILNYLSTN